MEPNTTLPSFWPRTPTDLRRHVMAKEASLRALSLWALIVAFGVVVVVVAVDVKLRSDRTKAHNQHNVRYWQE